MGLHLLEFEFGGVAKQEGTAMKYSSRVTSSPLHTGKGAPYVACGAHAVFVRQRKMIAACIWTIRIWHFSNSKAKTALDRPGLQQSAHNANQPRSMPHSQSQKGELVRANSE
jgi:hypothetical protein